MRGAEGEDVEVIITSLSYAKLLHEKKNNEVQYVSQISHETR